MPQKLTSRQHEILQWCARGKTSYEIGIILKLKPDTVDFHMRNIIKKLDVSNRMHAVAYAAARGIVTS